jgi:hypothetical protein
MVLRTHTLKWSNGGVRKKKGWEKKYKEEKARPNKNHEPFLPIDPVSRLALHVA